jgi:hypothetical protein
LGSTVILSRGDRSRCLTQSDLRPSLASSGGWARGGRRWLDNNGTIGC